MSALSGTIDISNIINELQRLIGEGSKTSVDELTQAINRAKKAVRELKEEQDSLNKSMAAMTEKNEINNSLQQLQSGLEAVTKSLQRLREDATSTNKRLEELSQGGPGGSDGGKSSAWGDLETQLKNVNLTSEDLKKNFLDVKTTIESNNTSITTYKNGLDTTVKVYKRVKEGAEEYRVSLEKINQAHHNTSSQAKYIDSAAQALKRLGLEAEDVSNIVDAMNGKGISNWTVANKSIKANGDAVYELRNNLDKVVNVTQKNVNGTNQFSASLKNVTKNAKEATKEAGTWGYSWKRAWQSFLTYMSVTDIFFRVKNAIEDMVHEVEELDEALTELKKVTDFSAESLEKFVNDAYKAGETVAKTGTEMIEAATQFAKAGYDEKEILKLGTIASMYTNIADETIGAGEAAEFIIAQLKAFNLEASQAEHVIDAVNEVSNNFAVSSADIANNLGKASAVMANAGNSMEQMIGIMTAGTEITRNASKVANGLKTITLRLQGMNDEGEKDLELQSQMEGMFKKLGISVYDASGQLKNTYDILATLATVYKDLTEAEKAYVTETIAGKFQAQNAAAILNNWSVAVEATETAMNSTGSAAQENERVLESIKGHLQGLSSAWENFARTVIDSDLIKMFVDLGTTILRVANSDFGQFMLKWAAFMVAVSAGRNIFTSIATKLNSFTSSLSKNSIALILNTSTLKKQDKAVKDAVRNILKEKGAYDSETGTISKNTLAEVNNALSKNGVATAERKKIMAQIMAEGVSKKVTAATWLETAALEARNAAATLGISLLISGGAALITSLTHASEEAAKRAKEEEEELRNAAIESGDELNNRNKSLDEYIAKYKTLKEELDKESTSYSRSVELRSEIIGLQKDINTLLGDEKSGIDLINDSLDETIEKQNKIKKDSAIDYMNKNAAAIATAQKNLEKNYYDGKRNKVLSHEWDLGAKNIGDKRWRNITEALQQALYKTNSGAQIGLSGWGGKKEFLSNIAGFDKEYFADLIDGVEMTAAEAEKMWGNVSQSLQKHKEDYMKAYSLSEEDFQILLSNVNKNYNAASEYIKKQQEVLDKAAESMVYSDDTFYQKMLDIQAAQAEYNKAKAEGNDEGVEDAVKKLTDLNTYIESIDNENVKKYFKKIIEQWETDINENNIKKGLKKLTNDVKNSLSARNITGDNFKEIFDQYRMGITDGLDPNQLALLSQLNTLFEEGGYSIENYTKYLEDLGIIGKSTNTVFNETKSTLKALGDDFGIVENKYAALTGAVDEFNEKGYLTAATFKSLVDKNLLDYLVWTENGLEANTQALLNEADALKINALESLQESYAKDVLAIANGDLASGTPYLTQALKDEKGAIDGLGDLAKAQTGGLFDLSKAQAAVAAANGKLDLDKHGKDLEKLNNYYNKIAQSVANLNLGDNPSNRYTGSGKKNSGSGSGSRSSSSAAKEKEWWEKEYDALKSQFDYSEITIEQYIGGLEGILNRLDRGSEAWKKINKELQKQRLDKIKNDYDAGRISLNQYIISLQNLQQAYAAGTAEWNKLANAIKKAKIDKLKKQEDALNSALAAVNNTLEKQKDAYKDAKEAAEEKYDKEIEGLQETQDALDKQKEEFENAKKAVDDFLSEQLESINNQKTAVEDYYDNVVESLEKMNEEQEEAVKLAEAYEALMNAMTQKTKKVWKEGLGWVWTADQKAIEDAKKNYEDLVKNAATKDIEKQKEKTVKSLDEQIEALQNYIDSWDKVFDKFDNETNQGLADKLLGENWAERMSQLDPQIVEDFSNAYYDLQVNLKETEEEIERINKLKDEQNEYWESLIKDLETYQDKWKDVKDAYGEAQDAIAAAQLMGANWEEQILNKRLNVLENFKNQYNRILSELDKMDSMSENSAINYNPYTLPGFSDGGEVDFTGLAMLHGSPAKPEYVLNNDQMKNLLSSLVKPRFSSNFSGGEKNKIYNYNFGNIELPNVNNAQQFINELKSLVNVSRNL